MKKVSEDRFCVKYIIPVKPFCSEVLMQVLILLGLVLGLFCVGFRAADGSGWTLLGGGAGVLMLSELDGMQQSSGEAGDRRSCFAVDLAVGGVGQEAGDCLA
jgi:hypothetical protein